MSAPLDATRPAKLSSRLKGPWTSGRRNAMTTVEEIRLKSRPVGMPTRENFELATAELRDPGSGEVQVKNLWMTVDPYMRGRMNDVKSYAPPFQLGKAMDGGAI